MTLVSVASLQNNMPTAAVPLAFVPCLLSCAGISFHAPASLIKATRLSSELRWRVCLPYLMCFPCSILLCCADQRPARNSSRGIIQKKQQKKTERERGSRYKRCSSEQMIQYWWRGKAKGGTTSVTSGENQQDWTCILFQSLLLLNQGMNSCDTVGQTRPKKPTMTTTKSLALKRPLKFSQTVTSFHTTCNLRQWGELAGLMGFDSNNNNCPVRVEAGSHDGRLSNPITSGQFCSVHHHLLLQTVKSAHIHVIWTKYDTHCRNIDPVRNETVWFAETDNANILFWSRECSYCTLY